MPKSRASSAWSKSVNAFSTAARSSPGSDPEPPVAVGAGVTVGAAVVVGAGAVVGATVDEVIGGAGTPVAGGVAGLPVTLLVQAAAAAARRRAAALLRSTAGIPAT